MKSLKQNNSFIIEIKDTQNESWQGTIKWINGNKDENFRSALELIKLIDSALNSSKKGGTNA